MYMKAVYFTAFAVYLGLSSAAAQIDTLVVPPKTYFYIDWSELTGNNTAGTTGSTNCEAVQFSGHTYAVVQIGAQCWFAENLKTPAYANGVSIPDALSDADWSTTSTGAMHTLESSEVLYNWYAAVDARGICPAGWKVPSNQEWYVLGEYLGAFGGKQLKSAEWDGTDDLGFNALQVGLRQSNGTLSNGNKAYFWTRTPMNNGNAMNTFFQTNIDFIERDNNGNPVRNGFSIRCLKD